MCIYVYLYIGVHHMRNGGSVVEPHGFTQTFSDNSFSDFTSNSQPTFLTHNAKLAVSDQDHTLRWMHR